MFTKHMIFLNKNVMSKFPSCPSQSLFWEFGDRTQYPPDHMLSPYSLVKKQILLTAFELARQFLL